MAANITGTAGDEDWDFAHVEALAEALRQFQRGASSVPFPQLELSRLPEVFVIGFPATQIIDPLHRKSWITTVSEARPLPSDYPYENCSLRSQAFCESFSPSWTVVHMFGPQTQLPELAVLSPTSEHEAVAAEVPNIAFNAHSLAN